jgi:hypothetical protein
VYSLGLTFSVATRLGPFVPAAVQKFWRIGASWIAPQGRKRAAEAGQKPVRAIKVFAMHSCAGELRGMQLTENFGFLGDHDPDLVKIGALAEPIFVTIPRPPYQTATVRRASFQADRGARRPHRALPAARITGMIPNGISGFCCGLTVSGGNTHVCRSRIARDRQLKLRIVGAFRYLSTAARQRVQRVLSGISGDEMPRKLKPTAILGVDSLSVSERVLLFCVVSDTDPIKAGVSSATQVMISPFQVRSATVQHRRHGGVNGRGKGRGQGL